jgi:hypothetical protein
MKDLIGFGSIKDMMTKKKKTAAKPPVQDHEPPERIIIPEGEI